MEGGASLGMMAREGICCVTPVAHEQPWIRYFLVVVPRPSHGPNSTNGTYLTMDTPLHT